MKKQKFEIGDIVYTKTGIPCIVDGYKFMELIDKVQEGNITKLFYDLADELAKLPKEAEVIGYYKTVTGDFYYYLNSAGTAKAFKEDELLYGSELKKVIAESYDKLSKIYAAATEKINKNW